MFDRLRAIRLNLKWQLWDLLHPKRAKARKQLFADYKIEIDKAIRDYTAVKIEHLGSGRRETATEVMMRLESEK